MYRNVNQNPFSLQAGIGNDNVLLPNLLNAKRHHLTRVSAKGHPYLNDEKMENHRTVPEVQFEKQTQHHTLRRSESFYHDSLQDEDAIVPQKTSNGTMNSCPSPSQQQQASHGYTGISQHDQYQFDSCRGSRVPKPWAAVVDPSSGCTYYWNQETNEVQWAIPQARSGLRPVSTETHNWNSDQPAGLHSILKGTHKRRSDQSLPGQFRKKVRFDLSEEVIYIEARETSFTQLENIWEGLWDKLSGNVSSFSLDDALSYVLRKSEVTPL